MKVRIGWPWNYSKLRGDIFVVIDVLRFSTFVITAISSGFKKIYACEDFNKALEYAKKKRIPLAAKIGDEKPKEADLDNSPSEVSKRAPDYLERGIRELVVITNSGSVITSRLAFKKKDVIIASTINSSAVAEYIIKKKYKRINLICGGVKLRKFAIEDFIGAGALIDSLMSIEATILLDDESLASVILFKYNKENLAKILISGETGKEVVKVGHYDDIEIAAKLNSVNVIPKVISIIHDGIAVIS
ncbi:MAG TPA: 2-phosphosulfolactate phosphatase [Geobacterales bacterium]|nr:2-phosphosulfolactate phosphatase [Geobacterales bacterium]